jgi:hypothetical protein
LVLSDIPNQDDFVYHDLSAGLKPSSPLSLSYSLYSPTQVFARQFLVPADAPKSKPFSYEARRSPSVFRPDLHC